MPSYSPHERDCNGEGRDWIVGDLNPGCVWVGVG